MTVALRGSRFAESVTEPFMSDKLVRYARMAPRLNGFLLKTQRLKTNSFGCYSFRVLLHYTFSVTAVHFFTPRIIFARKRV